MLVGTFCSFVMGIFNPYVVNKAGPDWLWGGGRNDMVRNLYFRHDGTFRRYGRLALIATLFGGSAAVFWNFTPAAAEFFTPRSIPFAKSVESSHSMSAVRRRPQLGLIKGKSW